MSHFDHASLEAPDVNGLDDLREQAIGKQDERQNTESRTAGNGAA